MRLIMNKRRVMMNSLKSETATETGDIVTFETNVVAPMGVVANFAPVQDLHGQSSPYPAGGGKNLADPNEVYVQSMNATTGNCADDPTNVYRVLKIDALSAGTYTFSTNLTNAYMIRYKYVYGGETTVVSISSKRQSVSFTLANDVTDWAIAFRKNDSSEITEDFWVQVELGSIATDYAPYSNICPITGWTGCNVYDDSKYGGLVEWNQIMPTAQKSGTWTASVDTTYTASIFNGLNIPTVIGHKYYVSAKFTRIISDNNLIKIVFRKSNSNFASGFGPDNEDPNGTYSGILTALTDSISNITVNNYYGKRGFNTGDTVVYDELMLVDMTQMFGSGNEPTTVDEFKALFPKSYYPYNAGGTLMTVGQVNGEAYRAVNVDWTDTAGTVYGGSFDVASGVLTAKWECVDLGTLDYTNNGNNSVIAQTSNKKEGSQNTFSSALVQVGSSTAVPNMPNYSYKCYATGRNIAIKVGGITFNNARTMLSGIYMAYELETPITYTLTPTQIKSLRGKNNVWCDTNEDTSVTYVYGVTENAVLEP